LIKAKNCKFSTNEDAENRKQDSNLASRNLTFFENSGYAFSRALFALFLPQLLRFLKLTYRIYERERRGNCKLKTTCEA
jgi:hypothetical protein